MKKILLLLIPAAFVIQSCNKGCTDPNANNYVADATNDDGNCTYDATVTFWYDQNQSIAWDQSGVTTLDVEVGGVSLGTAYSVSTYWVTEPTCADAGTINVNKNLGADATKSLDWVVKDQNGATLKSGTWSAVGGSCSIIQVN